MTLRRPRTAAQSTALPSLAALLASGVAVVGCDSAADSAERSRRLSAHGQQAGRELQSSRHGQAATEVGIGLGLIKEPDETRISSPGEATTVNVEPPITTAGVPVVTQPTPPTTPTPVDVDGGIRRVDPVPPTPQVPQAPPVARGGARRPVAEHPPRVPPRGGAPAVEPGQDPHFFE